MVTVLWTLAGVLLGSISFALLIGRLLFKIDIRKYGDGNPGATNLWKAKGFGWGAVAYIFDFLKGALIPGLCFYIFGIHDWNIVPIALGPIIGHAFSPFLKFRGGKAIATTYGSWAGLTLWEVPVFLALITFVISAFQKIHSWIQVTVMVFLLAFILLRFYSQPVLYPFMAIWLGNLIIIVIKHADELNTRPKLQPWLLKLWKKNR
jgi:glycerol-3-phosphate acyltransferase PlsY